MNAHFFFEALVHFVFWCSIATLFLACIERSANKFFPGSRFATGVAFATDIISQFGALNLRAQISPAPEVVPSPAPPIDYPK